MLTKKLTIAVDFDDVLADCNKAALNRANEKYDLNLSVNDITAWGHAGNDTDRRLEFFNSMDFYNKQELLPGAKEFIKRLTASPNRDVLIVTAIPIQFIHVRAQMILNELPEIKPENIIMATRKDLVKADVLLDDSASNILKSIANYRVLFRRPWNQQMTGILSVNNYNEFLALVDRIEKNGNQITSVSQDPLAISLVGPSGSGKTAISSELSKSPLFAIPTSCTTRKRRDGESESAYYFLSEKDFIKAKEDGRFLETTSYANASYGMQKNEIERIWAKGQHAVMPVDICGANAMSAVFGDRTLSVFVYRARIDVVNEILDRKITDKEKRDRLISLDHEYGNQNMCDRVVNNDRSISDAAQVIFNMVKRGA